MFENRYKSKAITSNDYLFASVRYVHQNPVKAFIVPGLEDYFWSSYNEYIKNYDGMADKEYLLSIIDLMQFRNMHSDITDDYDPFDKKHQLLMELRKDIVTNYRLEPEAIAELPYHKRREILLDLRQRYTAVLISKITHINERTIRNYK